MNEMWTSVIDFMWIAFFFVLATMIKSRIGFFRSFIVPTAIIAGFLGLLVGPEVLNLVKFDLERLGNMVYHLMAIGFIALSLKERSKKKDAEYFNSGVFIVSNYAIQGVVGFSITLFLTYTFMPNLFAPLGLLLPLGYGQGPGQAYSIGIQWEELGLTGGGNLGLTIAAFGFLWATIVGVIIVNYLIRTGKINMLEAEKNGERTMITEEISPDEIPLSDAHDKLTFQIAIIGVIYLISYFTIYNVAGYLESLGTFGQTFAQLLWGFHFLVGSLYAIVFRIILNKLKAKGLALHNTPNNYLLQRIAGSSFDFMITASIAAISFFALKSYWIPIILITTIGGFVTIYHSYFVSKLIYRNHQIENFLGFYGMGTGTISTGMALLKAVDPKFKTNVSENLVMGSAVAVLFGIPLMVILNIPVFGIESHQPIMFVYTLLLLIAYLGFLYAVLYFLTRKQRGLAKQKISR